jgi:hypothetical protein
MLRLFLMLSVLSLTGCASIPLSTMLEFRSFDQNDFVHIQPRSIQAKIQLDEPVYADVAGAVLSLELNNEKGLRSFQFPLVLLEEVKINAVPGVFSEQPAKTEYRFALSEEAVKNFQSVQQIVQQQKHGQFNFSVSTNFEPFPEELEQVYLSVLLMLSEQKGFVTLIDRAAFDVKRSG